jgi:hypothetical protein
MEDEEGRGGSDSETSVRLSVTPTTGGMFELSLPSHHSIDSLKKLISKRLKVPKERICLLHRERYSFFFFLLFYYFSHNAFGGFPKMSAPISTILGTLFFLPSPTPHPPSLPENYAISQPSPLLGPTPLKYGMNPPIDTSQVMPIRRLLNLLKPIFLFPLLKLLELSQGRSLCLASLTAQNWYKPSN